jgi:ferredoxin, 2Fe-2S
MAQLGAVAGKMPGLTIITRDGSAHEVVGQTGTSVMEAIRAGGFTDELLAICGGCCSCATCHVYVDPAYAGRFPPIGGDEGDLLEGLAFRAGQSRLSCQLTVTPDLDGARFTIAPAR